MYLEKPRTDGVRAKILLAPCLQKCNFSGTLCRGQFWMWMGASARPGHCVETDRGRHFHRIRLMDDCVLQVWRNWSKKEGTDGTAQALSELEHEWTKSNRQHFGGYTCDRRVLLEWMISGAWLQENWTFLGNNYEQTFHDASRKRGYVSCLRQPRRSELKENLFLFAKGP